MIGSDVLIPHVFLTDPDRFGGVAEGAFQRGTPVWRSERLVGLEAPSGRSARILLPRLVEAHCHLDKCHTLARLGPVGGDLRSAIEAQRQDKANWTEEDLLARATQGRSEARYAGCGAIRTHVDWGDVTEPPLAWQVFRALGVQMAALTSVEQMCDPGFAGAVAGHVAEAGGVLGAFLLDHDPGKVRTALDNIFAEAERHSLMLDFHVDEGLGDFNGLEVIADVALARRFEGPILCGHAVSLMNRSPDDVARIADKLARAGISVCALPTTNLYLQDRKPGTPDRRGITRLRELHEAGVRIVVGSDNVADAFCPVGAHDPMAALHLALLTAHLDPPLERWLPAVTTDAAAALGLDPPRIAGAHARDILLSPATTTADLIAGRAPLKGADT